MRLYSKSAERLYLNGSERRTFTHSAATRDHHTRLLCLFLLQTGCRLTEALNVRSQDVQINEGLVAINSLKKRDKHHVREIPLSEEFAIQLSAILPEQPDERLWVFSRTTAWRQIKAVMDHAGIYGSHATPKGLRHSFGVHCAFRNVPMSLTQKWLGHADIKTTAIYYQIVGEEEREMARRLW